MKCGQRIQVVNYQASIAADLVAQCGGSFLTIVYRPEWATFGAPFCNGESLWGWPQVLERLIRLAADTEPPFSYMARTAGDLYVQVTLERQMKTSELARLLDAPLAEVRGQAHDWIVIPEPQEVPGGDDG